MRGLYSYRYFSKKYWIHFSRRRMPTSVQNAPIKALKSVKTEYGSFENCGNSANKNAARKNDNPIKIHIVPQNRRFLFITGSDAIHSVRRSIFFIANLLIIFCEINP